MSVTHVYVSRATEYGAKFHNLRDHLEAFVLGAPGLAETMLAMSDQAQATDEQKWAPLIPYFGVTSGLAAKKVYDELSSLSGKLADNASQAGMKDAVTQVLKFFR